MTKALPPPPHDWREGRRLRAWELKQQGWTQQAIAAALGVTAGAVSQWMKRGRVGGVAGLRRQPPPGPRPKLNAAQRAALPGLLARGAEAYGFIGQVWTNPRVATVIQREFGVRYHPAHVCRLLRQLAWSAQTPRRVASQRDDAAVERWYAEEWPTVKKTRVANLAGGGAPPALPNRRWDSSGSGVGRAGLPGER